MACARLVKLTIIISTFLLCSHFSSQKTSTDGREKPSTNVWGMLTDTTNHSYRVENITVSGRFHDIAVYQRPTNPQTNPDINTTRLNLCEIYEIRIDTPTVLQFNNRDYIEITVVSNDTRRTQNRYIIERLRKLFCDEINEAGPIEKELSFLAVRRLEIQGCKKQEEEQKRYQPCPPPAPSNQNILNQQAVDLTITKTQSLINELETVAGQLPSDQQEGTIKSQILQLLDDLKNSFKNWFA